MVMAVPLHTAPAQERRRYPREALAPRFSINLLQTDDAVEVDSINFSQGGLCLRLQGLLEVRSLVRLQLTPQGSSAVRPRAMECTGRVAWVIQRLDLRDIPPFLYDIGVEFVDPPPLLRHFLARNGGAPPLKRRPQIRERMLEPALIRGRRFTPRLTREQSQALPWHLVVEVDGVPCHSGHHPSERTAVAAWEAFRRRQAKSKR